MNESSRSVYESSFPFEDLQCAAVCCSVVQCAAECCSVLQCVAVCCSVTCMMELEDEMDLYL